MTTNTAAQRAAPPAAAPHRLQLVYATHQQLEDELDTLRAYVDAARKHHDSAEGGFSPWTGVRESAERCTELSARCLRLFSPVRRLVQLKGLQTLTDLYGSAAPAPLRVAAFLRGLSTRFGDRLPWEVMLSGGRCLQRLDAAAAAAYLTDAIVAHLTLAAGEDAAFVQRHREALCLGCDGAAQRAHLRAALLLVVEAAAQATTSEKRSDDGSSEDRVAALLSRGEVTGALGAPSCAALRHYKETCDREARRQRESAAASPSPPRAAAAASGEGTPGAASATPSASTAQSVRGTTTGSVAGAGAPSSPSSVASGSSWKWHALRITVLILLAVLVRFASGPLARALKSVLQATHATQSRRRTLTL